MKHFKRFSIGLCGLLILFALFVKDLKAEETSLQTRTSLTPTVEGVDVSLALGEKSQNTEISILDSGGTLIATLHKGSLLPGQHIFSWRGKDEKGRQVKLTLPYATRVRNEVLNYQEGLFVGTN